MWFLFQSVVAILAVGRWGGRGGAFYTNIQRRSSRFFTISSLCHELSGAVVCKSPATHRVFITCNMLYYEPQETAQAIKFNRVKSHLFNLFIGWTIKPMKFTFHMNSHFCKNLTRTAIPKTLAEEKGRRRSRWWKGEEDKKKKTTSRGMLATGWDWYTHGAKHCHTVCRVTFSLTTIYNLVRFLKLCSDLKSKDLQNRIPLKKNHSSSMPHTTGTIKLPPHCFCRILATHKEKTRTQLIHW